jgi:hypothetical protein
VNPAFFTGDLCGINAFYRRIIVVSHFTGILYLVETSEARKPLCWVRKEIIDKAMLKEFSENQLRNTEKEAFEDISCKTNKHFGIPFENKKRTRGLLISAYNCGIVNGYREIFGSESVRQVVLFYLDLIKRVENLPGNVTIFKSNLEF